MIAVLAHQGGWDEILLVAVPILAIVALLALAKRRADTAGRPTGDPDDAPVADPDGVGHQPGRHDGPEHSRRNAG